MVAGWLRLSGPAGSKCGWRQRSQPGRGPVTGGGAAGLAWSPRKRSLASLAREAAA
jgi:hypothetical protein